MNSFVSMIGLTSESTSLVEDFSPTSTFHASPKTAFTNLLDLAFAFVLHIILFPFKDYSYYHMNYSQDLPFNFIKTLLNTRNPIISTSH